MTNPIKPGDPCPKCRRSTTADDHFAMCHPCMTAWYTPQPGEPVYYGDGFGGHDTEVPAIRIRATTETEGA